MRAIGSMRKTVLLLWPACWPLALVLASAAGAGARATSRPGS